MKINCRYSFIGNFFLDDLVVGHWLDVFWVFPSYFHTQISDWTCEYFNSSIVLPYKYRWLDRWRFNSENLFVELESTSTGSFGWEEVQIRKDACARVRIQLFLVYFYKYYQSWDSGQPGNFYFYERTTTNKYSNKKYDFLLSATYNNCWWTKKHPGEIKVTPYTFFRTSIGYLVPVNILNKYLSHNIIT